MPTKRRAKPGKASKEKTKRNKKAPVPPHVPAATYTSECRGLAPELIIKIFRQLEDPVTATSFGLVNHLFNNIFNDLCDEVFPGGGFPLKIATVVTLEDKNQVSLRAVLESWFPRTLFWDPTREKFVPLEYMEEVVEEMLYEIEQDRDDRAADVRTRRDEKKSRQAERAERKEEHEQMRESTLEGWRQGKWEANGSVYDIESEDEPSDWLDTDSGTESGVDVDLDSDVDQLRVKPDWKAMGIPGPSFSEWKRISQRSDKEEAPKRRGGQTKKRGRKQANSQSPARSSSRDSSSSISSSGN